jgi:hypothetical protein
MQQTPGFSRRLFRGAAVATAERQEPAMNAVDDFFGIEDLLDQAYEDAVYLRLTPTYLK